jgi:enamine deaminase RidA (YjgF/YER057c/UK114 family)
VKKTYVSLGTDPSRGIDTLRAANVPAVFSDAVRVEIPGCTFLYISGKVATDDRGHVAPRTIREQTRQVLENIKAVLDHENATMDDIVRLRVYVTQLDEQSLRDIHEVRAEYFQRGRYPASTLVRVHQLVRKGSLIEIDADAVMARA